MAERSDLSISVHGPGASIESAVEVAEAMKELLATVGEELGVSRDDLKWKIGSIRFRCDGCDLRRPDKPGPNEGWTHADEDDFCPTCTEARRA